MIFRGYDFSIFLMLLFLDRCFGVFDSDLRASPSPICLVKECPHPGHRAHYQTATYRRIYPESEYSKWRQIAKNLGTQWL